MALMIKVRLVTAMAVLRNWWTDKDRESHSRNEPRRWSPSTRCWSPRRHRGIESTVS